jgi:hypothetical protein
MSVKLRIVMGRDVLGWYHSVRFEDQNGCECEILRCGTALEAARCLARLEKFASKDNLANVGPMVLLLSAAIRPLALRIAQAEDQQGTASYATKAHMRSWAAEIVSLVDGCMELAGLQPNGDAREDSAGDGVHVG